MTLTISIGQRQIVSETFNCRVVTYDCSIVVFLEEHMSAFSKILFNLFGQTSHEKIWLFSLVGAK